MNSAYHTGQMPLANYGTWAKRGIVSGIVGGVVFAAFEMLSAAALNGIQGFFVPLRMIGAIILGPDALQASYPLAQAAFTGLALHMVLSMVFGLVFAELTRIVPGIAKSEWGVMLATSVGGLLLWLVNFYAIAPAAGWNWFPGKSNAVVQFFAHTFFFGSIVGLYLNSRRAAMHERP